MLPLQYLTSTTSRCFAVAETYSKTRGLLIPTLHKKNHTYLNVLRFSFISTFSGIT